MNTLTNASLVCLAKRIWVAADCCDVETAIEIGKYVRCLPVKLIDQLFAWLVNDCCSLSTSHVAVVLHHQCRRLVIDDEITSPDFEFDVNFLLDVSGDLLHGLTELQLPVGCRVDQNIAHRLSTYLPNIEILNLYCVNIDDESLSPLSTLHLKELNLTYAPISNLGLLELCRPQSHLRRSLKILHTYGTKVTKQGHLPCLAAMLQLEDIRMDASTCSLLSILPEEKDIRTYSLTKIRSPRMDRRQTTVEDLKFAARCCPKVSKVRFHLRQPCKETLNCMSMFDNLSGLCLECESDIDCTFLDIFPVLRSVGGRLTKLKVIGFRTWQNEIKMADLDFPQLIKLTLIGNSSHPISESILFAMICKACNLEKFHLGCCEGLNDRVVFEINDRNPFKRLKILTMVCCRNLGISGACDLLRIPTLKYFSLRDCLDAELSDQLRDEFEKMAACDCQLCIWDPVNEV